LSVFQQPAIDDFHRGHALKDPGHHHFSGQFAVPELDFEFVPDFDAVQAAPVDIGGVHQIVVAGDDIDGPVINKGGRARQHGHQHQA
jgi:hypothetical protein